MTVDKWQPIADYEVAPLHLADKELAALAGVWAEQKAKLRNLPGCLSQANQRLDDDSRIVLAEPRQPLDDANRNG